MTQHQSKTVGMALIAVSTLWAFGCGGDGGGGSRASVATVTPTQTAIPTLPLATVTATAPAATATRTPTSVPTATSPGAQVAGVIVVNQDVGSGQRDGLSPLPPESLPPVGKGFDRGLGNADWTVDDGTITGTTTADGHFSITGLTPGRHRLNVRKTVDGNLLEFIVPIVVGDDGAAEVVAEVSWGMVRATSTYTEGGAERRAVFAPNATSLITSQGRVIELSDGFRTLVDADGDGHFDATSGNCEEIYSCNADGGCGSPERICLCIPSCPGCEDCPERACIPRASLMRPDCGPDGLCKALPYRCGEGQTCATADEQCTCVSSCLGCDNCATFACVSPCTPGQPTDIVRIDVYGQTRLVIGQESSANAVATLSDGTSFDVTWLATWASSSTAVATVDSWGRIATHGVGATDITAALGEVTSAPLRLEVVERPTLLRIHLQNANCYYPLAARDDTVETRPLPPDASGFLPPPSCQQVVRIGGTIQFSAIGEFDTGYYDDITDEVEWRLVPAEVGTVVNGLFTGVQAGEARLSAALAGVESDALSVKVVTQPTIVALSIYPSNYAYQYIDGGPVRPGDALPCFDCGYSLTLLRGDTVQFSATAHYDTGEWEDVTGRVTWRSSDTAVATISASGLMTAVAAGEVAIDATLGDATSSPVAVRVVNEATLVSLYAYMDGQSRAIGKGEQAVFHAVGYYDVGFDRDVTNEVTWRSSDENVGGFDTPPGVFTGRSAGNVSVWAELAGQQSPPLPIEVFATSELAYCDAEHVNRGFWSDDFNRVTLESDCATYTPPDVVELRFSVTETQRPGGIFDPCLDLYAFRGADLVRTIRQEGCGDPFVAAGAPDRDEAAVKYQLKAFWDLKDEGGATVPAGVYTIRGVFYLYYDPVVAIDVTVNEPNPTP